METTMLFLNLDGIPSAYPREDGKVHFFFDPQGIWRPSIDDRHLEIDGICVHLHDDLKGRILDGVPRSEKLLYLLPEFVSMAGHNSEAPISRNQFEQFLTKFAGFPEINRFLYLADCQKLVSSIQEGIKEVIQIQGEFFHVLNTESFFYPPLRQPDGVRYSTSPVITKLFAYLSFILIRMHSLLDYTVKVCLEAEQLRNDFKSYPRMTSLNEQYGGRKRVSFNGKAGTLFEDCTFLTTIETLRNHLIHDGMLDDMPKGYEVIKDGNVIEKYMLMPDMTNGRFDRLKNRILFFGGEDKINSWLPGFTREFMMRLERTLETVRQVLRKPE
jgi:hypothetical protein